MNTKIGTSFGLALLMAFGVVVTMLVMGLFAIIDPVTMRKQLQRAEPELYPFLNNT